MTHLPTDPDDGEDGTWAGLVATAPQAMEWGIDLCGQLAAVHAQGVVVGDIRPATIGRTRFGQPTLPAPDGRATHEAWVDVAALAQAIGALVPAPPPELVNALLPPYASAVALGQELQDAQRAMGLPVAPIPFDDAPPTVLGGYPLEVPPDLPAGVEPWEVDRRPGAERPEPTPPPDEPGIDDLDRTPDFRVLLLIAGIVLVAALAIGIGWR